MVLTGEASTQKRKGNNRLDLILTAGNVKKKQGVRGKPEVEI